jgi:hypothetical protein
MFAQFLPNKNKMLQYAIVQHSNSAVPNLAQLNKALIRILRVSSESAIRGVPSISVPNVELPFVSIGAELGFRSSHAPKHY